MGYRKIIERHSSDINNLAELLFKFTNSYRLLIGGASDLNSIALAKKKDVRDAIRRADELGEIIDELLEVIDYCNCAYFKYCKIKSDYINCKNNLNIIKTEVDEELSFFNEIEKKP
ncbi:hypothetical protein [Clostridium polynesiense]|uniref:hypothetical protein n=1 Tax=Clostridium polynesiense TaxID=1325933 RepID=UPI0005905222|nr:hypothetical protein [Clostridium polynesiense]